MSGEKEPVWLTPYMRDSQPEEETEVHRKKIKYQERNMHSALSDANYSRPVAFMMR